MGWAPTLTWLRWGDRWALHRRTMAPPINTTGAEYFKTYQKKYAMIMCKNLIENPEDWMAAVTHFAVSIMMKIAYGIETGNSPTSEWVKLAAEASEAVGKAGAPASSIMDRIPWSKFFPPHLSDEQFANMTPSSPLARLAAVHGASLVCSRQQEGHPGHY